MDSTMHKIHIVAITSIACSAFLVGCGSDSSGTSAALSSSSAVSVCGDYTAYADGAGNTYCLDASGSVVYSVLSDGTVVYATVSSSSAEAVPGGSSSSGGGASVESSSSVAYICNEITAPTSIAGNYYFYSDATGTYYYDITDATCTKNYLTVAASSSSVEEASSSAIVSSSSSSFEVSGSSSSLTPISSSASTPSGSEPTITFSTSGVTVADNNTCVVVDGSKVTITCAGNYWLTGSSSNGQVVVNAGEADDVYLYLQSLTLSNSTSAPIIGIEADRVFLNAYSGTSTFSDASTRTASDFTKGTIPDTSKACIYAKTDLTLMGSGSISVSGNYNNGIHSTKDIRFKGSPTVSVTAKNNGIKGNNSITVEDYTGATTITTTSGDGMHVEDSTDTDKGFISITDGTFKITSGADGIQAYRSVVISGGTFTITCGTGIPNTASSSQGGMWAPGQGGGTNPGQSSSSSSDTSSYKGIKSNLLVDIKGGSITIDATDDALHSDHNTLVEGGYLSVAGRNGAHADDSLIVSGGTFLVRNSYEGFEATCIFLNGGYTSVYAIDDGWNGSSGNEGVGYVYVNAGTHLVYAGGDGLDSNGDFYLKGGSVFLQQGNGGGNGILDVGDGNYKFYYQGGTLVAVGTSQMPITSQISGTYSGYKSLSMSAGSTVTVSNGSTVIAAMKLSSASAASAGLYMINESSSYTMAVANYSGTLTSDPGATGISYYDGTGNGN